MKSDSMQKHKKVISPGTFAPTTFLPSSWISTDVAWLNCFTLNRASVMLCNREMCYAIVGNKKYELNNPGIIVTKNGVIVYNHALWARSEENRGNHSDTPFSLQNKIIQPNHAYCLLDSCPARFFRSNLVCGGDPSYRGGRSLPPGLVLYP